MTTFATHQDYDHHEMHPGHPECPERLQSILRHLRETGLLEELDVIDPPEASAAAITRVHDPAHYELVCASAPKTGLAPLDSDTAMGPGSLRAAKLAAGALEDAVKRVLAGETKRFFSAARPPGHHAEHDRAMGFCFFNNVAVGAACALQDESIERVAILDFDVHHGNGTVEIFKDRPEVLVASSPRATTNVSARIKPNATRTSSTPALAGRPGISPIQDS